MLSDLSKWANDNQGVLTVLIFVLTLSLGWTSGIFQSLRRKPRFRFDLIDGPTFCSTFPIGQKHGDFDVHRTAIALYLKIFNVGSASSSVANVSVAYHWQLRGLSPQWIRYRMGWYWVDEPVVVLHDFQHEIGENIKVYPALFQVSATLGHAPDTFLNVGQGVNGVVYFEQPDSYGGCFPKRDNGRTKIKVAVTDAFGRRHTKSFWIPVLSLEEARKYNPRFGGTLAALGTAGSQPKS